MLREITTINASESYHSMVRTYTNIRMKLPECTIQIISLEMQSNDGKNGFPSIR